MIDTDRIEDEILDKNFAAMQTAVAGVEDRVALRAAFDDMRAKNRAQIAAVKECASAHETQWNAFAANDAKLQQAVGAVDAAVVSLASAVADALAAANAAQASWPGKAVNLPLVYRPEKLTTAFRDAAIDAVAGEPSAVADTLRSAAQTLENAKAASIATAMMAAAALTN